MWTSSRLLTTTIVALFSSGSVRGEVVAGSYWGIYNASVAPADSSCLVEPGVSVAESCCTSAGERMLHTDLQGENTCFILGEGLVPFSGCVGEGMMEYGEDCTGEGAPFVAADAAACGCDFIVKGSGCYKANDIPGQQWFVFLNGGPCKGPPAAEKDEDGDKDDSGGSYHHTEGSFFAFVLLYFAIVAAL